MHLPSKRKSVKEYQDCRQRNQSSVDFYLHMTNHCVIGDYTLVLTFQFDHKTDHFDDVLVVSSLC